MSQNDSLVVFYAGHGGTRTHELAGKRLKTGYLIPVDAASEPNKLVTWIDLKDWLRKVSLLPPKHILMIIDACYSGIALDPVFTWRGQGPSLDAPLPNLQARRSRRIITSALDDQLAIDRGPVDGHSLFTGCLIEALSGGLSRDARMTTGSALGIWVQERVRAYPDSRQTPDVGAFELDDRGEMVIPLVRASEQLDGHSAVLSPAALPAGTEQRASSDSPAMDLALPSQFGSPQRRRFTT